MPSTAVLVATHAPAAKAAPTAAAPAPAAAQTAPAPASTPKQTTTTVEVAEPNAPVAKAVAAVPVLAPAARPTALVLASMHKRIPTTAVAVAKSVLQVRLVQTVYARWSVHLAKPSVAMSALIPKPTTATVELATTNASQEAPVDWEYVLAQLA